MATKTASTPTTIGIDDVQGAFAGHLNNRKGGGARLPTVAGLSHALDRWPGFEAGSFLDTNAGCGDDEPHSKVTMHASPRLGCVTRLAMTRVVEEPGRGRMPEIPATSAAVVGEAHSSRRIQTFVALCVAVLSAAAAGACDEHSADQGHSSPSGRSGDPGQALSNIPHQSPATPPTLSLSDAVSVKVVDITRTERRSPYGGTEGVNFFRCRITNHEMAKGIAKVKGSILIKRTPRIAKALGTPERAGEVLQRLPTTFEADGCIPGTGLRAGGVCESRVSGAWHSASPESRNLYYYTEHLDSVGWETDHIWYTDGTELSKRSDGPEKSPDNGEANLTRAGATASASSALQPERSDRYSSEKLIDGDTKTAWGPKRGRVDGEWIEVRLPAAAQITKARIRTGHGGRHRGRSQFKANRRLKRVDVLLDGVFKREHSFADDPGWQDIVFDPPAKAQALRLEILDAFEGTRWEDLHVSEVQIWGIR